jgi:hypothetical protein
MATINEQIKAIKEQEYNEAQIKINDRVDGLFDTSEEVTIFTNIDFENKIAYSNQTIIYSINGEEAHQEVSPKRIDLTAEQIEQIKAIILAQ